MITGEPRTMAVHELRDKARLAIAYATAGTPVMVFQHGDPAVVLITWYGDGMAVLEPLTPDSEWEDDS